MRITPEWLRAIGGLPDNSNSGELCFRLFELPDGDRDSPGSFAPGEYIHIVICPDGSVCIEEYDDKGDTVAAMGLGIYETQKQFLSLLHGLKQTRYG